MMIQEFESGPVFTKTFIIVDEESKETMIIDAPFDSAEKVISFIETHELLVVGIVLTHGHWDHVGDVRILRDHFHVNVMYHKADSQLIEHPMSFPFPPPFHIEGCPADQYLSEGDSLRCGNTELRIIHVPGHTKGHIALHDALGKTLFSGDVLFEGSIGRTDLPGGNYDELMNSIATKLLPLDPSTRVYAGHGNHTTIGDEASENPFLHDYFQTRKR